MLDKIEWNDFATQVAEFTGREVADVTSETNIFSDLGMDSLGLFSLGLFLIKTYKTRIPLSSVATLETVGDIFATVNKQRVG
jgi:acyl carrier protein